MVSCFKSFENYSVKKVLLSRYIKYYLSLSKCNLQICKSFKKSVKIFKTKNSNFRNVKFFKIAVGSAHVCCRHYNITIKKIKIYIGLIVLFSFLYNFPICFERWYEWDNENKEYKMFYTRLRKKNEPIGELYRQVYETYMYNIFYIALPLVCLIVFNILIVRKVCMN